MKRIIVLLSICLAVFTNCVQKPPTYRLMEISNVKIIQLDEKFAKETGYPYPSIIIIDSFGNKCILAYAKITDKKLCFLKKLP